MIFRRFVLSIALLALLSAFASGERLFAPGPDLWPRWTAHDPESVKTIDHSAWDRFLGRHVRSDPSGVNLVDYAGVSEADRGALKQYLEDLAALPIGAYARDEQLAYWINLYNALTVDVVLDHYPVDSIRDIDISPGLFSVGPWGRKLVTVEGEALSLNDIEHRILRPIWQDPRIHYAVNCAAIGCPNLQAQAFTGDNADSMMEDAGRAFVNDPRGVSISGNRVTVSRIYDWFIEDFERSERGILRHLGEYAEPELAARLTDIGALHDTYYDWSLNELR